MGTALIMDNRRILFQKTIILGILLYLQVFILHSFWLRDANEKSLQRVKLLETRLRDIENQIKQRKQKLIQPQNFLPDCQIDTETFHGRLNVTFEQPFPTIDDTRIPENYQSIDGLLRPQDCNSPAGYKLAIIIPFRDTTASAIRVQQLKFLLFYMIPVLIRQKLTFRFYIINQTAGSPFNRAKLLNIGFLEASQDYNFDCFIFHDVDLILEDDRCLYRCDGTPQHYSVAIDKFHYRLPYRKIFGGITQFEKNDFLAINGYSNEYWGWGGEDDDMFRRVTVAGGFKIRRPSSRYARYRMMSHSREKTNARNSKRRQLVNRWRFADFVQEFRWKNEGLNQTNYDVVSRKFTKIYVNITVDCLYDERLTDEELFLH